MWKTGLVCPPNPDCLRSYLRFPIGKRIKIRDHRTLSPDTFFTLLVLGNLVRSVFLAFSAESITLFWDIDLTEQQNQPKNTNKHESTTHHQQTNKKGAAPMKFFCFESRKFSRRDHERITQIIFYTIICCVFNLVIPLFYTTGTDMWLLRLYLLCL